MMLLPETRIEVLILPLLLHLVLVEGKDNPILQRVQQNTTNGSSTSSPWLRRVKNPRAIGCWNRPWICNEGEFPPRIKKLCCRNRCVDVTSDPNNCGLCGIRCPFTWQCCRGLCIDTNVNPFHCGSCDHKCPFMSYCVYGMCGYAQPILPPFPFPPRPPKPPRPPFPFPPHPPKPSRPPFPFPPHQPKPPHPRKRGECSDRILLGQNSARPLSLCWKECSDGILFGLGHCHSARAECSDEILLWQDSVRPQSLCSGRVFGHDPARSGFCSATVTLFRQSVRTRFCSDRILFSRCHSARAECSDGILFGQNSARPRSLCSGRVFGRDSALTEFCSAVVTLLGRVFGRDSVRTEFCSATVILYAQSVRT
ncbi:hypothetical protein RJ639_004997 [Escallonia herrerae]|uniref:Stigma-specific Stig1 family protein n=1 Tax=Escallonia herrerae TaxID=1293975 RepID=A0AA89AXX2_9ASTE|nr:hypothetical protein RJ639_004997 [Escallonia herrerae]